jgi:uncharacterized damage-inducible protein DinB
MFTRSLALLIVAAAPLSLAAQSSSPRADAHTLWQNVSNYIVRAAADVPESKYGYKPTPEVRSFGELIGHVAGSQAMFCAIALGEKPPAEDAVEKSATSKADLVKALDASNEYCRRAYAQNDASMTQTVELFGGTHTRLYTLMINATHDNEHYGNIVTYMRLNGMVPPSSQPRPSGD